MAGGMGFSDAFLKSNPEVKKIVDQAVAEGWDNDKFMDAVRVTKWWKTKTDTQKQFDVERVENPAEINRKIAEMQFTIRSLATRMGFSTPSAVSAAKSLAEQAIRNGWGEDEVRFHLGARYSHGGDQSGIIGQTKADLKEMAGSYGLKVSPANLNNITRAVLQGVRTTEDYEAYFVDQAKRQYAGIADQIDKGITVRQILDPYLQQAAEELGVNPATLDITNSMWNAPVAYTPKGESKPRAMTFDEWTARYRTDTRYGFDKGQTAQRQASIFTAQLAQEFGAL